MALSPTKETVLEELVERTPDGVEWCIFGSTDSVLRGLDDDPADVDTTATEEGAETIRELFSDEFVETRELGVSARRGVGGPRLGAATPAAAGRRPRR